jgi:SEFIR domain-containing protein
VVEVTTVFVSYAHESDEHGEQVLALATFLRSEGVTVVLDRWATHERRDWYAWAILEMTRADFVLVVASRRYRAMGDGNGPSGESRGVTSEAALLRELVYGDRAVWLPKVLPVLLAGHGVAEIPLFLQPHTASRYVVPSFDRAGAEELLRVIRREPATGETRPTPPPAETAATDRPRVLNQINGTVHGKVIQVDTINGNITF